MCSGVVTGIVGHQILLEHLASPVVEIFARAELAGVERVA